MPPISWCGVGLEIMFYYMTGVRNTQQLRLMLWETFSSDYCFCWLTSVIMSSKIFAIDLSQKEESVALTFAMEDSRTVSLSIVVQNMNG